jgi:beta-mannosidase
MAGEWRAGVVDAESGVGPPEVSSWSEVTVPGRPERFVGADAVAYRKKFPDPRQATRQRVILDFRGLYGSATVYLNGEVLGHHDTYFQPARFEFEPEAENELVVVCRRPTDGYAGVYRTDEVPARIAVPGIWWGVHLRLRPPAFLADLTVNARRPEPDRGVVDVAVSVDATDPVDDSVTLSVRPENFRGSGGAMERVPVDADAGERVTVTRSVEVREPAAWWPADRGDPNRYTVRASFRDQERAVNTGFCDVAYDAEDGLRVNGDRVRARGVNVLPTTEPEADLERARELNATLVRVHGHVLPESFYDAADAAGVFVAQDLPLVGPDDAGVRSVDRGRALARAVVSHVDHHPSLACYGVHDDPIDPFADRISTGRTAGYRIRTRAARASADDSLATAVAEAFPADAVVFPTCGPLGSSPDAANLYPGWDYGSGATVDWLLSTYPEVARVVSEFGAGSVTKAGATPAGLDRDTLAGVFEDVDAGPWGDSPTTNDEAALSAGTQARVLARVASGFRRHRTDVLAAYCLRDVDDDGGFGVYAHDGTAKPAADALAEALAPVQAFLVDDPPGEVDVALVNDAPAAVSGTLTVECGDVAETFQVEAAALCVATAGTVSIPRDATVVELSFETGAGEVTRSIYL